MGRIENEGSGMYLQMIRATGGDRGGKAAIGSVGGRADRMENGSGFGCWGAATLVTALVLVGSSVKSNASQENNWKTWKHAFLRDALIRSFGPLYYLYKTIKACNAASVF